MAIVLKGLDQAISKMQNAIEQVSYLGSAGLNQIAEDIMSDSKENYVPVDIGTLKGSGHVVTETSGNVVTATMAYGGPAAAYAVAVHEHLSPASPASWRAAEANGRPVQFHPSGRGPKYLERPVLAKAKTLLNDLA